MSIALFIKGNFQESYKTCLKALECDVYKMEVWVHVFYVLSAGRFNIKNLRKIIEKLEINYNEDLVLLVEILNYNLNRGQKIQHTLLIKLESIYQV